MRVLMVHNRYQIRGGEDESFETEVRLLREGGHRVNVYEEHNDRVVQIGAARTAARSLWSRESYAAVQRRLRQDHYDVMHVQNFFPLISPSVYYAAAAEGVPVVQSLRNYRLLCPNGLFYRDGAVCEDCVGKSVPWPAVLHACYRGSRAGSASVAAMLTTHRLMRTWQKKISRFIALTEFARDRFIAAGFDGERISLKPNAVHPDAGPGSGSGGYAVFVGRLSAEKGIRTLLRAWDSLQGKVELKIIGEGPEEHLVREACARNPAIQFLGRRPVAEVYGILGQAGFLVLPSEWYETFGRVAAEAYMKGTPVIASRLGAMAELVHEGETGFLFEAGNPSDLAAKVERLLADPAKLLLMRARSRREYETRFTAAANRSRLVEIYNQCRNGVERQAAIA